MPHSTSVSVRGSQLVEDAKSYKSLVIDDSSMTSHFYEDEPIDLKLERHALMTCAYSTIMNYQKAHELPKDLNNSTRAMVAHFRWGQFIKIIHTASASTFTLNPCMETFPSGSLTCFATELIARIKDGGMPDVFIVAARMIDTRKSYSLAVLALCTLYREINYWVQITWQCHFPSSNHRSDAPLLLQISGIEILESPYSAKEARKFLHEVDAPQGSQSLHKVHDKNASPAKSLDIFKDYREPASSGNSSDEDETQPKTNDSLSSHEDISKQDTPIQQDQIMVVPQMNSKASESINSVEQTIQVFLEESKDQALCVISPSSKGETPMHRIYHIKNRDEISELQRQAYSIHVPLMMVDEKQSDEAPLTPVIDVSDDIGDEGPVDPSMSSVADVLLLIFVKEFCE
ncbi:uncharacterized protein A4U43_C07F13570 [Asparagus officinalis]|uniref:Uncharacterized protein n=1 Tax=Asparagus officinalis TaxID=4686 RepID=A0A5P1EBS5_ASPOF|nr:uncharacterized protein A4U43_C07F13570 [Asparagus officinalis]